MSCFYIFFCFFFLISNLFSTVILKIDLICFSLIFLFFRAWLIKIVAVLCVDEKYHRNFWIIHSLLMALRTFVLPKPQMMVINGFTRDAMVSYLSLLDFCVSSVNCFSKLFESIIFSSFFLYVWVSLSHSTFFCLLFLTLEKKNSIDDHLTQPPLLPFI